MPSLLLGAVVYGVDQYSTIGSSSFSVQFRESCDLHKKV